MIQRSLYGLLLLLPGLVLGQAQPAEEPDEIAEVSTQAGEEQTTETPEPAGSAESSVKAEDEADAGSPYEYRASEQISEDLSVSFPVDI